MKIAIDIRDASGQRAGKGSFAFGLVGQILAQDKRNQFILYTDQEIVPFPAHSNIQIKRIHKTAFFWHFSVLKDLRLERPDLYFAPTSYIVPALAPRWLKVVLVVHDLVAFLFPKQHSTKATFIERLTLGRALKKASKVIVVSRNTQKDLMKYFQIHESKITVISCATNPDYQSKPDLAKSEVVREKYHLPPKFVLGVGTLEPRKNFTTLIKSYAEFKKEFPEYKLVIVGKKGWQYQDIEKTVEDLELRNDVLLTGYMDDQDLREVYQLAEMLVFPSLYEGFGIPPLEALASDCPVVASNTSSLPEVVGDAGILIEPHDVSGIAQAMKNIVQNPKLRNTLVERGHRHLLKYSWNTSAKRILELFKQMGIS